jgi:hypothetical protein
MPIKKYQKNIEFIMQFNHTVPTVMSLLLFLLQRHMMTLRLLPAVMQLIH